MINYTDKGPHCIEAIIEAGYTIRNRDHVWVTSDDAAVQAIIDAFDPLPDSKTDKIAEIKREAATRANAIYEFITVEEDRPATDALAFYNFASDLYLSIAPGSRNALSGRLLDFDAIHSAAVAAIAAINALTTRAEVEAYDVVNTPSWP